MLRWKSEKITRFWRILARSCIKAHALARARVKIWRMKMDTNRQNEALFNENQPLAPQPELACLIERLTKEDGPQPTAISALNLFRFSRPSEFLHSVFKPVVCLVAQGSKRMMLGDEMYIYDPSRYLLVTVDLPVASQVIEATPAAPYLSLSLDIDTAQVGALIAEMKLPDTPNRATSGRGIAVGCLDALLQDAFLRLLRLLEQPQHIDVLAPLIMREIFYFLLVGDQGDKLRRIAFGSGETQNIVRALHWIKHNFAQPLRIEEIAREVHLSPSAFHHNFKALTAMTPLQYQKQLRLQEARRLMLGDALDAATAGLRVGYESASQFNREYHRLFGDPPRRDIARLRSLGQISNYSNQTL